MSLERERAIVDYDPSVLTVPTMVEAVQRRVILPRLRRTVERAARRRRSQRAR